MEDGDVDFETVKNTRNKILWLVEEVYDIEFEGGILWLLSKLVRGDNAYDKYLLSLWKEKEWNQIISNDICFLWNTK